MQMGWTFIDVCTQIGAIAAMGLQTTTAARGLCKKNARLNTVMTSAHDSVYCKHVQKQASFFIFADYLNKP